MARAAWPLWLPLTACVQNQFPIGRAGAESPQGGPRVLAVFPLQLCWPSLRFCPRPAARPVTSSTYSCFFGPRKITQPPPCPGSSPSFLALVSQPAGNVPTASLGLNVQERSLMGHLSFCARPQAGSLALLDQPSLGCASTLVWWEGECGVTGTEHSPGRVISGVKQVPSVLCPSLQHIQ